MAYGRLVERHQGLLPQRPRLPLRNRPPIGNRIILAVILFVLRTGIAWADLPRRVTADKGYDSGR
jgi:transposase